MWHKYSRFIKILSVILVVVISSVTNRYASEVKSSSSSSESTINYDDDAEPTRQPSNQPKSQTLTQPGGGASGHIFNARDLRYSKPSEQQRHQVHKRKLASESAKLLHDRTSLLANDLNNNPIYSSLKEILENLKHRVVKEKLESRLDSKKTEARNELDLPTVDLIRNGLNGRQNDLLIHGDNVDKMELTKSTRNTRNVKKQPTPVEQVSVAPVAELASQTDQDQGSDIFNEPLRENFNEVGGGLASIAEEETKAKKTTYSTYLGTTDQMPSSPKVVMVEKKPTNQRFIESSSNNEPPLQPMRSFSPKFEDFVPNSWKQSPTTATTTSNSYTDIPESFFNLQPATANKKSRENFISPSQDVSFNDYDQHLSNGFSTTYNEGSSYQNLPKDVPEDPPMESIPVATQGFDNYPSGKRNKQQYTRQRQLQVPSFSPRLKHNSRYVVDNEYLSSAQLEQQEEDGNRWPKVSSHSQEYQASLRPKPDYNGIHLQQVYAPLTTDTYTTTNNNHEPQNRNKRLRDHRHQAQQQQVYYSLVNAPQSGFKTSIGSRPVAQSNPAPLYETSTSGSGVQPQRDLVNQPQTIQITAIPSLGLNNNNNPFFRGNGNPLVNGAPLALLNNGAFLDPSGRQILMVNSDRRQIDWSFIIWPLLVVIVLPLFLSALFVPIFMKSFVLFLQILHSLGLIMPTGGALGLGYGGPFANMTAA